jgi:DNA-binding YbaB/EbfC family protein
MFKELGQLASLMKNLPKIQENMQQLQQRLGQVTAEGATGAGMVRVRVNGRMEMVACLISEEAMQMNDREMLEDLIKSATNQALEKVRQQVAEETAKMAGGLGLPPGFSFPGLGE